MTNDNPWIAYRASRPRARLRLFCFPYAGGGASVFRTWSERLPPEIEVCPVQLPGREGRIAEPLFDRLEQLVPPLAEALRIHLGKPFAFFGHSMGAMISFELARRLRQEGGPSPVHLFASGCMPPHLPDTKPIHHLPDEGIVESMRVLGGMPEEILQNRELMELMNPVIRADSAITETYAYTPGAPLRCRITAFGGLEDPIVTHDDVNAWRQHTSGVFTAELFAGNHFFLQSAREELLGSVSRHLLASLPGSRS